MLQRESPSSIFTEVIVYVPPVVLPADAVFSGNTNKTIRNIAAIITRIQVNFPKKKYGTWDLILFVLNINMHLRTNVCEPLFSNLCSYYNTEHSFVNTILTKNRTFV